ncbi:DUF1128 domain-containing protein [Peribacillus psychrosaccharolyticus]|uniref:UPF0435 protein I6J18_11335 n=1 Tax=Peribacillus psychrosaccharolyticus TaxID=1407 RepID=A0A974S2B8_PERPY|nr:DUF1128 domain-containing protein [Peribacillus psychrosaccharolyticus]MEC2057098.1 DUF1128 domain-containing protein [Peribacillus psychrosaccharolyticus]MED3745020.1 DUF1128 domain-containing protein [Peribacillus psychrosaccharolyticus]QQT02368.1 DUF1128 domain-containing protein [Peribacillus psychrosaccharolyticus]
MDLSTNTPETIEYMVDEIKTKLKFMNFGAIKSTNFNSEMYEELRDIYEMVMRKGNFSPREMEAIAEELGRLRK